MTEEQSQMFRLLRTFSEICEENGLRYFVVGGTLIGAVRHRGFIPLDDDIDVSMPLDDFRKFTELARELPGSFALQSEETDPRYPFVFAKLCDTRYAYDTGYDNHPMGVYIDIFPLIPARALSRRTKLIFDMISVSDYVLQVKLGWTEFVPYKKPLARAGFRMMNCLSATRLRRLRRRLIAGIYDEKSRSTLCSPGGAYSAEKEFFPAEWFAGAAKVGFEGVQFDAPQGWDEYLRRNYGNYMELPPVAERRSSHKK